MELVKFENLGGSSVAATTSLRIAEFTSKEHKHVLRDIETLIKSGELDQSNFEPIFYKDSYGRDQKAIVLDETLAPKYTAPLVEVTKKGGSK
jgi:phage regulator Rha-like protein